MKSIIASCAIVSAMSVGCAPDHGMHYTIMIDSGLSVDQISDTVQAAEYWQRAVPGLTFDYVVTQCSDYQQRVHTICVFLDNNIPPEDSTYHVLPCATTDWSHGFLAPQDSVSADSATVHLWSFVIDQQESDNGNNDRPYTFANTITHELGHAMTHRSDHPTSGMMSATEDGHVEKELTSSDVDYFWSTR